MTRGYVCIVNKNEVERVAYLSASAYPSWYGLEILKELQKGTDSLAAWISNIRKDNIASYGKKNDPCKGFALNWIRPDKESRAYSDWRYSNYGYVFDTKSGSLKVYWYGTLLYNIKADKEEFEKYLFIFDNENCIYDALSYDADKLADVVEYTRAMKMAAGYNLTELQELVEKTKGEEHFYLSDDHLIAYGFDEGHEVYTKQLSSSGTSNKLEFIVEHDHRYTDYGWEVLLQCPYIRCHAISGPNRYGRFCSEKAAVEAIRKLIKKAGTDKMMRTADIFKAYKEAENSDIDTFVVFLDSLNDEWKKEPWYTVESCTVENMIRKGREYIQRYRRYIAE